MSKVFIDPPEGWKFGFPKTVDEEIYNSWNELEFHRWLVDNGYPRRLIESLGDQFHIRCWREEN